MFGLLQKQLTKKGRLDVKRANLFNELDSHCLYSTEDSLRSALNNRWAGFYLFQKKPIGAQFRGSPSPIHRSPPQSRHYLRHFESRVPRYHEPHNMIIVGSFIVNIGRELVFVAYPTASLALPTVAQELYENGPIANEAAPQTDEMYSDRRDGDPLTE
jgi:hypothetical protein